MTAEPAPSMTRGWYLVLLLCVLYTFSLVDRLVLGLLAVDIGRDLHATDSQLGLLIGTSFAITYSLAGLPLAHFLDRGNRKWIVVGGVILWSSMTIMSAFASSYLVLGVLRSGVALGEAVLTPAAISLIADMFPKEKRVLPTAVYAAMGVVTIGSLTLGAAAYQIAQHLAPVIGSSAWRLTLVITGAPPLLIGLLFAAVVREPQRGPFDDPSLSPENPLGTAACINHLKQNRAFYLPLYLASAMIMIFLFGVMTWTPSLLIRAHGANPAQAGYLFGMLGLTVGVSGSIFWPHLVVKLARRGRRDPVILCLALGMAFGAPFAGIGPTMTNNVLFLGGTGLGLFGCAVVSALMPLAIQTYGPPRLRARLVSLTMLAQSLIGYGIGPVLIAELAKLWPNNQMALGYALSLTGLVCGLAAAGLYALSRRALRMRPLA